MSSTRIDRDRPRLQRGASQLGRLTPQLRNSSRSFKRAGTSTMPTYRTATLPAT